MFLYREIANRGPSYILQRGPDSVGLPLAPARVVDRLTRPSRIWAADASSRGRSGVWPGRGWPEDSQTLLCGL